MKISSVAKGLYRGSRPVTDTDWRMLVSLRVQRVINLEGGIWETLTSEQSSEAYSAYTAGIELLHVPMNAIAPPSDRDIGLVLAMLQPKESMPITLVHCRQGVDRTGFVIAAYRMQYQKKTYAEALAEMKAEGFHWWYWYWLPFLRGWQK